MSRIDGTDGATNRAPCIYTDLSTKNSNDGCQKEGVTIKKLKRSTPLAELALLQIHKEKTYTHCKLMDPLNVRSMTQ